MCVKLCWKHGQTKHVAGVCLLCISSANAAESDEEVEAAHQNHPEKNGA